MNYESYEVSCSMVYLKLAFTAIRKNKILFTLIILEIASLILVVNVLICTLADRKMLDAPYRKLLNNNAMYVWDTNYNQNMLSGLAKNPQESFQLLLSKIEGEYKICDVSVFNGKVNIIAVSDEIFDNLTLPLISGDYTGAVANLGGPTGDYIFGNDSGENALTIKITGTLTSKTYLPLMQSFRTGSQFTTKDFYLTSDEFGDFIITRKSTVKGNEESFENISGKIIQFKDEESYKKNLAILSKYGGVQEGKNIIENSQQALRDDLFDFLPVALCILFIVIIGTVSISAIMYLQSEYKNGVLWICGYSRQRILLSHLINMLIVFLFSIIISIFAYWIMSILKIEIIITAKFSLANLMISLILCALLVVLSMAIPMARSSKASPIEYLRRSK